MKRSAVRSASAMIVNAGFAAGALGKTELSHIHRFSTVCDRPNASTTLCSASSPIRNVPITCAERGSVQQSVAPAACHAAVISFTACSFLDAVSLSLGRGAKVRKIERNGAKSRLGQQDGDSVPGVRASAQPVQEYDQRAVVLPAE